MKVKSILNFQDAFFVEVVRFPVNNKPNQGSLPPNLVMIIPADDIHPKGMDEINNKRVY